MNRQKLNSKELQLFIKLSFLGLKKLEVNSLALVNSALNFESAMKNFFKNKNLGFPKFKSKHKNHFSYTINNQKRSTRFENQKLKLPKIGFVKVIGYRKIPKNFILKSTTISKTPSEKQFISILFKYDFVIPKVKVKNFLGLDFSMKELFISSDGFIASYPRFYYQGLAKLARFQRILNKAKKAAKTEKNCV